MALRHWRTPRALWNRLKPAAKSMRPEPTPAEAALWAHLSGGRKRGLSFRRQHPLDRFVVDFYCAQACLAVEVDGTAHEGLEAEARDAARDEALQAMGMTVLRFAKEVVLENPARVARAILRHIAGAGVKL